MPMAQEKQYENRIKKYLDDWGAWYVKYWAGATFTKSGVPDILCCVRGTFMGIEVKASNGKPTPLQVHNLKKIDEAGGYAVLAYPEDWHDVQTLIEDVAIGSEAQHDIYEELKERWLKYLTVE